MTNRMRVSGTLGKRLKESKVSPDAVLRQAGLPLGLFQQSKIFLTTEEMFALYNAIEKISGDSGIGLKLGSDERPEHYSAIAIAALYTRSFRDAMERIARYKRLTGPQEIRIAERGKECAVEFLWLLAEKPEPLMLIDMCFAWAVAVGGRGTGRRINPLRVEFKRPAGNRRLYESHFRCPVTFAARHNRLIFRTEDMNLPFLTHNPELLELIAPQLDAELRHLSSIREGCKDRHAWIADRSISNKSPMRRSSDSKSMPSICSTSIALIRTCRSKTSLGR